MGKKCIICNVELNETNTTWYRVKNYIYKCNECLKTEKRESARLYRKKNPNKSNERSRKYNCKLKKENPKKYTSRQMYSSAKKRSIALGKNFDLTTDYILTICPDKCPVFGFELKYGGGDKTKSSASLDRLDSSEGYTKENVQVVSMLANLMMSNATKDEQVIFAKWVLDQ